MSEFILSYEQRTSLVNLQGIGEFNEEVVDKLNKNYSWENILRIEL